VKHSLIKSDKRYNMEVHMVSKKLICLFIAVGMFSAVNTDTALAADIKGSYDSKANVGFTPGSDPTLPIDPEYPDPEKPVRPIGPGKEDPAPGTVGPLSIDFASSFDFGVNEIVNTDATYFARAQHFKDSTVIKPNYVQVTDTRGLHSGWSLRVKQMGQFKSTEPTRYNVLDGAQITMSLPKVSGTMMDVGTPLVKDTIALNPLGTEEVVMYAAENVGSGTWITYWGKVEEVEEITQNGEKHLVYVNKAITLDVPGRTPKDSVEYQTEFVWILSNVPGMEQ
jgi:hypothetical protein